MPSRPRPSFVSHLLPGSLALCGLAIACAVQGEERRSLEPMVVTGSYNPSDTFDLPFSVDSIERRQIADGQLGINLSEVLPRVPGLVVQNRQNYAQDLQISSRGYGARSAFGIRGLKLLADGIPASTPDGQGQAATLNLDVAERIEVLRGPASTIYGSNAGGVIQMFSRDGQGAPRVGAETSVGSDGLSRNHLYTEGEGDGVGFLVDASRMDTDGYRDHSAARRDQTFAKLNFRPDADSRLALIYSSLEQNDTEDPLGQTWDAYKHDPRSVTANAELYDTRKSIDHQQAGMNYERYFGEATLQVNAYVGKRSVVQYLSIPRGVASNSQRGGGVVDFDRDFHGGTVRWLQPVRQAPGVLNLTVGLDYDQSRDDRRGYQNFNGDQLGVKGELRRDEVDTATSLDPYLQASWAIDAWTLQAGVRHSTMKMEVDDRYLSNGDASGSRRYRKNTPSFSVMYAFTPDLHGYLSAGKGFETPTQAEMAYAPVAANAPDAFNFGLKPATSSQYEAGLKARLWGNTRVNAAIFQIRTEDEIVVASSLGGRTSYQNAGKTLRRGFELGLESELSEHWNANLAYTRLSATYDSDFEAGGKTIGKGKHLPGVPASSLFGELVWKPVEGISMGWEGMYRSQVYVEDSNSEKAAPSYAVFNWRTRFEQRLGGLDLPPAGAPGQPVRPPVRRLGHRRRRQPALLRSGPRAVLVRGSRGRIPVLKCRARLFELPGQPLSASSIPITVWMYSNRKSPACATRSTDHEPQPCRTAAVPTPRPGARETGLPAPPPVPQSCQRTPGARRARRSRAPAGCPRTPGGRLAGVGQRGTLRGGRPALRAQGGGAPESRGGLAAPARSLSVARFRPRCRRSRARDDVAGRAGDGRRGCTGRSVVRATPAPFPGRPARRRTAPA